MVSHFEWLTRKDYDSVLGINLHGVIFVTKAFLPLVRQTPGRIVNMASIMGRFTVSPVPYSVAKFGVEGFSDSLRLVTNITYVVKQNSVVILTTTSISFSKKLAVV